MLQDVTRLREISARAESGLAAADPAAIDISPQEAWSLLREEAAAQLVDVRTQPEWHFVGLPALRELGKKLVPLSWRQFPNFAVNADFAPQLAAAFPDRTTPLLFICRTGGRSLDAAHAMRAMGYASSFNVAGGFEGDLDQQSHRGQSTGWKAAGLPWEQG